MWREGSAEHLAWLDQVEEDILDPALPICDPHHHLWDRHGYRYLLDELLSDLGSGHRVLSTVFVECAAAYRRTGPASLRPVGETEFVEGIAREARRAGTTTAVCAGIVGFADCLLGEAVGEVLDAHLAASSAFRGIRHAAGWDPSPDVRNSHSGPGRNLYRNAAFRQGFAQLRDRGLSFEAWQYHHQLPLVTELARRFPDTLIVLNHFSGPLGIGPWRGRRQEILAQWRKDLAECAACPNVVAKLGGLVMPVNGFDFHKRERPASSDEIVAATGDWYRHAIDCFGPERCMFESNFPVDKASVSYGVLWNAFKKLAQGYSTAERAALFHDTASRTYRL
ncbi:MAG: amidohydrolase family protein [Pseudomonadales bacterium]|jgi:predicted TIM-barrel fold metal-dependent hydrolase|nr:amidohydrolase family protein [Pseudomonadales bacterium]